MSSYKCPQCGLTNWNVVEVCKRCASPNPYLAPASQEAFNAPVADVQAYQQQPVQQQPYQQQYAPQQQAFYGQPQQQYSSGPDYNTPPPPNVYGAGAGANAGGYGYQQNPYPYQNRGYNRPDMVIPGDAIDKLRAANKQIKTAKIAANVWAILLTIGTIAIFGLSLMLPSQAKGQPPELTAAKQGIGILLLILLCITILLYGLAQGIKKKSMGSAIAFLVLSIIGILGSFSNMSDPDTSSSKVLGQLLFNGIMLICSIMGILGISTYKDLVKKYPQIDDFEEA